MILWALRPKVPILETYIPSLMLKSIIFQWFFMTHNLEFILKLCVRMPHNEFLAANYHQVQYNSCSAAMNFWNSPFFEIIIDLTVNVIRLQNLRVYPWSNTNLLDKKENDLAFSRWGPRMKYLKDEKVKVIWIKKSKSFFLSKNKW